MIFRKTIRTERTLFFQLVSYVNGPLQAVLLQFQLPMTMLLSFIVLGYRYHWNHFIGVVLIIAGIVLGFWPDIKIQSGIILWIIIFLLSTIPLSLSYILKEKWIKQADLNILYFRAWDSFFEVHYNSSVTDTFCLHFNSILVFMCSYFISESFYSTS